jgi:itaconate CoA-transferase
MQPLEGLVVVALEQAVAAPFATRQLADLGARVIKIERPAEGDFARRYDTSVKGLSSHFVWLNRSKESLTLNLKHPEAPRVLDRPLERADVFVQNLVPGAAERAGLARKALRKKYPGLIICDLSGYGSSGPYRDQKAYDLLVQCEAGLLSITGTEETPSKVGISIADIAAGMYAYSGILTALLVRHRNGKGTALEVSLFDSVGEWMGYPLYYTAYGGSAPARTGASHAAIAPYGPFPAADGSVYMGVQNEREWKAFCALVLERPDLAADSRFESNFKRVENRKALGEIIGQAFSRFTVDQVRERLAAAGIAQARLNSVEELIDHPQLGARGRWREIASPVGPLRALLPPLDLEGVEPVMGAVPALGQHTASILNELGFDRDTVSAWQKSGLI